MPEQKGNIMHAAKKGPVVLLLAFLLVRFGSLPAFCAQDVASEEKAAEPEPYMAVSGEDQAWVKQWERLDPENRENLVRRYKRWKNLSPAAKERIRRNLETFRSLPKPQRKRIMKNFHAFQRLPNARKIAILKNFSRWKRMNPQEQETLREKHRLFQEGMSPEERKRMREYQKQWKQLPPKMKRKILNNAREKINP